MSKIEYIGYLSPNAILAEAIDQIENIEYVLLYVSLKNKEEEDYVAWSQCELRDIAFSLQMISRRLNSECAKEETHE
jgi:hypothetical protein